jgi:hypothetical protein
MGSNKPPSLEQCRTAIDTYRSLGNKTQTARLLGIPRSSLDTWIEIGERLYGIERPSEVGPRAKGRRVVDLRDGIVLAASDFHFWPGEAPTAFRALIHFTKQLKPKIVIANGDILDFGTVSRHPPLGWTSMPTAEEEIETAQDRMHEWAQAAGKAQKFWPCGNHDSRLETFIASHTPELKGITGTSLADHFPLWEPCWSVWINDRAGGLIVKHRYKGGIHSTWNSAMWAGRSIATGHLHNQNIRPYTDYNGTRWGIDLGCIADPYADSFQYLEDNPRNWRSGFGVFTFEDGALLPPELVTVLEPGVVFFRGKKVEV